jgi:peroxiredoxin
MRRGQKILEMVGNKCKGEKMSSHYLDLPADLPVPVDDGAASHLLGMTLPDLNLISTAGNEVNLLTLKGYWVIYIYPMTGQPNVALPEGWNEIPGARGCTPQSCSFRDHYAELKALNTQVFGLSSQTTDYQRELKDRLHLPFNLLSDAHLILKTALKLPTFLIDGMELFKRLTLITYNGEIKKVFYPVFPPNKNADDVLEWLKNNR